jgi:hypothetical protein
MITVVGTGFTPGSTLSVGGVASWKTTFVSSTEVQAPVRSLAHTGKITVSTSNGVATSAGTFTVTPMPPSGSTGGGNGGGATGTGTNKWIHGGAGTPAGPPEVDSFTPGTGKFPDKITVTGKNFTGTTEVDLGTAASAYVTVVSDTELIAMVRSLAHSGPVKVINTKGSGSSTATFTVTKTYD